MGSVINVNRHSASADAMKNRRYMKKLVMFMVSLKTLVIRLEGQSSKE